MEQEEENTLGWDLKNLISHPKRRKLEAFLEKMKKILSEKTLAFSLVFIVFIVVIWLYQQGRIGFLPHKKNPQVEKKVVEILFKEKEYKLSYKDRPSNAAMEVAHFEEDENWQGDGDIDFTNFYEGKSSFRLVSRDHQKATLTLAENLNLEDALKFKVLINLETEPSSFETLSLIFGNQNLSSSYRYSIRELKKGWNLVVLPKEYFAASSQRVETPEEGSEETPVERTVSGWGSIQKVGIELVSRPKTVSAANFDFLWAEAGEGYQEDWNTASDRFLSLGKNGKTVNLLVVNLDGSTAALKKISSARDYTFQAKFTPLKKGRFGLFLRNDFTTGDGYYLMMDGLGTNSWTIYKVGIFEEKRQTIVLAKGEINNFQVEEGKSYLLKGELKGSRIIFYLSLDDKNLTKLGEARDDSLSSGGVGIAAAGGSIFLVDDIAFFQ